MTDVKIYKASKNVMQSGRSPSNWILEHEPKGTRRVEPLMGWTSSENTLNQVRLKFLSRAGAVAFAQKKGWNYVLLAENIRRIKPRNYSDNFKFIPEMGDKKA